MEGRGSGPIRGKYCHFSPEDADSMFLRNAGIYLWVYTASKTQNNNNIEKIPVYNENRTKLIKAKRKVTGC
jgi:hypothetical protein